MAKVWKESDGVEMVDVAFTSFSLEVNPSIRALHARDSSVAFTLVSVSMDQTGADD